jgi:hypothetical protein
MTTGHFALALVWPAAVALPPRVAQLYQCSSRTAATAPPPSFARSSTVRSHSFSCRPRRATAVSPPKSSFANLPPTFYFRPASLTSTRMEQTPTASTGMRHYAPLQSAKGERERPFHCPVPNCNGRFQRKFTLREHMKTHTGEKPYQCAIRTCGKRFSTSGNLARHRRLHMLKKLECPVDGCTRIFTKSEKLARHLQNHLGSVAHICVVEGCGKTFSTAGNLTRHLRTQHPPGAKKMTMAGLPDTSASMSGGSFGAASFGGMACPPSMSSEDQFTPWMLNGTEVPPERASVSDLEMVELLQCLFTEEGSHLRLQQHHELHHLRHVPQLSLPQLSLPQLSLPLLTVPQQQTPQHQHQHQHQQGQGQQSLSFLLSL